MNLQHGRNSGSHSRAGPAGALTQVLDKACAAGRVAHPDEMLLLGGCQWGPRKALKRPQLQLRLPRHLLVLAPAAAAAAQVSPGMQHDLWLGAGCGLPA